MHSVLCCTALTKVNGCVWYNAQHTGIVAPAAVTAPAPAIKLLALAAGSCDRLQSAQSTGFNSNTIAVLQPAAFGHFGGDLH